MESDHLQQFLAEIEERICTCGAGHGSGEGHTDWCEWVDEYSCQTAAAVTVRRQGRDRYGRTLAHVYVDGRDVARLMIEAGHAVPYHCPGGRCPRRIDWCGGAG